MGKSFGRGSSMDRSMAGCERQGDQFDLIESFCSKMVPASLEMLLWAQTTEGLECQANWTSQQQWRAMGAFSAGQLMWADWSGLTKTSRGDRRGTVTKWLSKLPHVGHWGVMQSRSWLQRAHTYGSERHGRNVLLLSVQGEWGLELTPITDPWPKEIFVYLLVLFNEKQNYF